MFLIYQKQLTTWPIATSVGSLQEAISLFEEEMIVNQLLLDFFSHSSQRVVSALLVI